MKLLHLTDIHLDCLGRPSSIDDAAAVGRDIVQGQPEDAAIVITGDIATGPTFSTLLPAFWQGTGERQTYFVVGNHDAWGSSIAQSHKVAANLSRKRRGLTYLPAARVVRLSEKTALVGIDGWYDGRAGDASNSSMRLNDWYRVQEFVGHLPTRRLEVMQEIVGRQTRKLSQALRAALQEPGVEHVVVATHVPPWHQASLEKEGNGRELADRHSAPWYVNHTLGVEIARVAADHPGHRITVLAGHTHTPADVPIANNLRCIVGAATYRFPAVSGVIEVP